MKLFGNCLLILFSFSFAASGHAAVNASIDRGNLGIDDSFVFTLTATAGEDLNKTNFSALNSDFEVRSSSRESSFSYSGGKQQASSKLRIVLSPKRTGKLTIPALNVDGFRTGAITIMVRKGRVDLNSVDEIFVEAEVSNKTVYVQSQLLYTFRLYRSIALRDADYSWAPMDTASTEQLEGSSYNKRIDGVDYQVSELRFAIFPQESGTLKIPPLQFVGQLGRGMFDRGPALRRQTKSIAIKVLPIPDEYPGAAWIPTTSLKISEDWSADPATLTIGDSSTRTVTLRAKGLPGSQLPPITPPEIKGIKIYPDLAKSEDITGSKGIDALGINSAAWVVIRDGDYEVPEVRVPWWDVNARKVRYAALPARSLSVAPATDPVSSTPDTSALNATAPAAAPANIAHSVHWRTATLLSLCGWLLTILLLRRRAPRPAKPETEVAATSEAKVFKQLLSACKQGQGQRSRQLLQDWLRLIDPDASNPGPAWLQQQSAGSHLAQALAELEASIYSSGTADWSGQKLALELKGWRKQQRVRRARNKAPELPALYQ